MGRCACGVLIVGLSAVTVLSAQGGLRVETVRPTAVNVLIDNFGKVNAAYYRGSRPSARDFADLSAIGIRTIINLENEGGADEPALSTQRGMRFVRIPLDTDEAPSDAQVAQFLSVVTDPANLPVFVHCADGRHRTGAMTAVYRMVHDGWTPAQAYSEMKQYGFETFIRHRKLRQFVETFDASRFQPSVPAKPRSTSRPSRVLHDAVR